MAATAAGAVGKEPAGPDEPGPLIYRLRAREQAGEQAPLRDTADRLGPAPTSARTSFAASTPLAAARSMSPRGTACRRGRPRPGPARRTARRRAAAGAARRERRAPWPPSVAPGARRGVGRLRPQRRQLGAHAGRRRGDVRRRAGVGVQLDHRAAGARRPLRGRALQPGVHGDGVQRRLAAHRAERRAGPARRRGRARAGSPRTAARPRPARPCRASRGAASRRRGRRRPASRRAPGSSASTTCRVVERAVVGLDAPAVPPRASARTGVPVRTTAAVLLQVRPQRGPDAGQVVGIGRVEPDALRVAEEVVVEHRDQLGGRQRCRLGEERAGERLEQHRLRPVRTCPARRGTRAAGMSSNGGGGGGRGRRRAAGERDAWSEPSRSRRPRLGERAKSAIRLSGGARGQAGEVLGRPGPRDDRVAADRPQERQRGVDAAQHVAPRVVVPEEGVEAVLDDLPVPSGSGAATRRAGRPASAPPPAA